MSIVSPRGGHSYFAFLPSGPPFLALSRELPAGEAEGRLRPSPVLRFRWRGGREDDADAEGALEASGALKLLAPDLERSARSRVRSYVDLYGWVCFGRAPVAGRQAPMISASVLVCPSRVRMSSSMDAKRLDVEIFWSRWARPTLLFRPSHLALSRTRILAIALPTISV